MKKLSFGPKTIDDAIIKDGLCAVSALSTSPNSKDLSFVVGGMATQSYLPSSCRRATADIDLAVLRPLGYTDFRQFSQPAKEYLQDNGYVIEMKKGQNSYHLIFSKKSEDLESSEACVLEFARRGKNYIERCRKRLQREFENARKKIIEGRDLTYRVSSPEDIIVPKLVRSVGSLDRNPGFKSHLCSPNGRKPLSGEEIAKALSKLADLRQEVLLNPGDPSLSEALRFNADFYDIRILSELVGINEAYLVTAVRDWDRLSEPSIHRDTLFQCLLPELSIQL